MLRDLGNNQFERRNLCSLVNGRNPRIAVYYDDGEDQYHGERNVDCDGAHRISGKGSIPGLAAYPAILASLLPPTVKGIRILQ